MVGTVGRGSSSLGATDLELLRPQRAVRVGVGVVEGLREHLVRLLLVVAVEQLNGLHRIALHHTRTTLRKAHGASAVDGGRWTVDSGKEREGEMGVG